MHIIYIINREELQIEENACVTYYVKRNPTFYSAALCAFKYNLSKCDLFRCATLCA